MRYIVTVIWSTIYFEIIGFICSALTSMKFDPIQSAIMGVVFGLLFAFIITGITAKIHKD